jgi:predicted SAM-dependent methyltransferase
LSDAVVTEHAQPVRVNVGSGEIPLPFFVNIDPDERYPADLRCAVPPLPFADGAVDHIHASHFLEHLPRAAACGWVFPPADGPTAPTAEYFLAECWRALKPGGALTLMVPDTREVLRRYLAGAIDQTEYPRGTWWPVADLDAVCAMFLYSPVQPSHHVWSYDLVTLRRLVEGVGFTWTGELDRYQHPLVGVGAWYQLGGAWQKPLL